MWCCADLVEDDEDELHDGLARRGVRDGLLDLREPYVAVAARGAEQLALETAAVVGADDASHVRELHVGIAGGLRGNGQEGTKEWVVENEARNNVRNRKYHIYSITYIRRSRERSKITTTSQQYINRTGYDGGKEARHKFRKKTGRTFIFPNSRRGNQAKSRVEDNTAPTLEK